MVLLSVIKVVNFLSGILGSKLAFVITVFGITISAIYGLVAFVDYIDFFALSKSV